MKLPGTVLCLTALLAGMAGAQKVSLRFSTWAGGDALALFQQLSKEYSTQNPDVQVSVEVTPFAGVPFTGEHAAKYMPVESDATEIQG